jgi:galactokinase/mevalonate kinase-like predicted kinase
VVERHLPKVNVVSSSLISRFLWYFFNELRTRGSGSIQMAKTDEYGQIVRDILTEYSQIKAANEDVEPELIFDLVRNRYQLVHVGWSQKRRIYGCILHLDQG